MAQTILPRRPDGRPDSGRRTAARGRLPLIALGGASLVTAVALVVRR